MKQQSIIDYLQFSDPRKYFSIHNCGNIFFHWSDYRRTCQLQQHLKHSGKQEFDFVNRVLTIHRSSSVCIRSKGAIEQRNLYDLYDMYSKGELIAYLGGHHMEISMVSSRGPFVETTIESFLNKNLYQQYVYNNIVEGRTRFRDFRLRCTENCICHYGVENSRAKIIKIRQFNRRGMLFTVNDEIGDFIQSMSNQSKSIDLLLDLDGVKSFIGQRISGSIEEKIRDSKSSWFFTRDQKNAVKVVVSDIQFVRNTIHSYAGDNEIYFFIPYNKMKTSKDDVDKVMKNYLDYIRGWLDSNLKSAGLLIAA